MHTAYNNNMKAVSDAYNRLLYIPTICLVVYSESLKIHKQNYHAELCMGYALHVYISQNGIVQ